MNLLLTLATTPGALGATALACGLVILLAIRSLRRGAAEDAATDRFLEAVRLSAHSWDHPTAFRGLSDRTDTASFPRIVLAGTVAG